MWAFSLLLNIRYQIRATVIFSLTFPSYAMPPRSQLIRHLFKDTSFIHSIKYFTSKHSIATINPLVMAYFILLFHFLVSNVTICIYFADLFLNMFISCLSPNNNINTRRAGTLYCLYLESYLVST